MCKSFVNTYMIDNICLKSNNTCVVEFLMTIVSMTQLSWLIMICISVGHYFHKNANFWIACVVNLYDN